MNTTNNVPSTVPSTAADRPASSRSEDRARLATLAAEFESMLLVNVLRDMRSSGRWNMDEGADMLGAETFEQTIDVELSRYLSQSGGFGLSQRLLSAFDALERIADAAPAAASGDRSAAMSAASAMTAAGASGSRSSSLISAASGFTSAASGFSSGRTGWNGMKLDAPPYGGSGAEWGGFNNDRAMAGGDDNSVKDGFFRWTYGLAFNPAGKSKEEIGSFLRDNIQSARDYGLNILDIQGEQILIETAERGPEWVDVVQSAGGPGAKWQWLCQTEYGAPTGGGALGSALASLRSTSGGESRARALLTSTSATGDALLASLRAESAAAARGVSTVAPAVAQSVPAAPEELRTQASAITSRFGWRQDPFSGATSFHRGVDLRAAEGDPVASTGAGRVTFSGSDGGYGTSIVVEHANGLSTRYAHLSAAMVNIGDQVEDGQILGLAGQTGRATAPHLHYEVRVDGRAIDPLQE